LLKGKKSGNLPSNLWTEVLAQWTGMDEKELIRLAQNGSREAFSTLVQAYKNKVFSLAMSLTGNRETADDLSQEVFIKAYLAIPKFRFRSEFGTWLYRIAVNRIKDYLRKASRRKEVSLEAIGEQEGILVGDQESREREAVEERRRRLVHEVLRELPPKQQIILSLRDIQGYSYEEIARILKISAGTVDSRLFRARMMVRKRLAPYLNREGGLYEMP
jgi:RNA polymerase sigma-70 factor (ECF subfamily)